jgi:hypothetical protein
MSDRPELWKLEPRGGDANRRWLRNLSATSELERCFRLRIGYGASLARMAEWSEFGWSNAHGTGEDDMPTHTHDIVKPQVSTTVNEKFH